MEATSGNAPTTGEARSRRIRELLTFIILAVVIWPFIAVGVVAAWGFAFWIYYIITGPPGAG